MSRHDDMPSVGLVQERQDGFGGEDAGLAAWEAMVPVHAGSVTEAAMAVRRGVLVKKSRRRSIKSGM
ncbi:MULTISPECIES: hypothetical protein [unclassified Streptomyces]|uniref:hypothetical protein n=1 Tax=unclassified Streptomyces TaxID=2593676 RepID=UPI0011610B9A|nr:hypothetical protein [Streptomyces sp. TSRI0107]